MNAFRPLACLCLLLPLLTSAVPRELYDSEGRLTTLVFAPNDSTTQSMTTGNPESTAAAFLVTYADALGLKDPATQLKALPSEVDKLGHTHLRWHQVHEGVPVRTGELALHLDPSGQPTMATAKLVPQVVGSSSPAFNAIDISILAESEWWVLFGTESVPEIREPSLAWVDVHALPDLNGPPRLAWWVPVQDYWIKHEARTVVLDANTGQMLGQVSSKREMDRRVYNCSATGLWTCPSEQFNANYNPPTGYWFGRRENILIPRGPNPTTQYGYGGLEDTDVLWNHFGEVHVYWNTQHGRNGANNLGGSGDGSVQPYDRTAGYVLTDHLWASGFCPDNATYYASWGEFDFCAGTASARDVVGHEYFHAVVWFEFDPHGTEYSYEIGALEEGACDLFGAMLEMHTTGMSDWHQYPSAASGGRSLSDPRTVINQWEGHPYPDRFCSTDMECDAEDHGGVHDNSTIPSHAAYLMTMGGLHNGCEIPAIGFEAVQRIWYRAWTTYFTRTTTFNESVIAFQAACQDLYGVSHPEYLASVTAALQAVEMDQPGYCSGIPEVAPACAVIGGGAAYCGLATGDEDSLFTTNESVWLHSPDGVPGRRVLVHRLVPGTEPGLWEEIPSGADTLSVTVGLDGVLAASLGSLPAGAWTLLLDGDHDGFWQPWADQQLSVTITAAPPRVTGLTARVQPGENPPTRIRLDWNPLPDAPAQTQYQVEGDILPQFPLPQLLTTTPDTTWTDSLSVTPPPLRLYRVKAVIP